MKRMMLAAAVVAAVAAAGCGQGTPAVPMQPPSAPVTAEPQAGTVVAIQVPLAPDQPTFMPVDLRVSPDGKGYALWHALQADGLTVWREGDAQAGMPPTRVAWAPGGDRVAVEVGSQPASSQILLLSTDGGQQRQFTGQNPVVFADRLYFLFLAQDFWQVMEVRLPDGEPTPVDTGRQAVLAGDPVHGRLFVFKGAGSQLTYLPVKKGRGRVGGPPLLCHA